MLLASTTHESSVVYLITPESDMDPYVNKDRTSKLLSLRAGGDHTQTDLAILNMERRLSRKFESMNPLESLLSTGVGISTRTIRRPPACVCFRDGRNRLGKPIIIYLGRFQLFRCIRLTTTAFTRPINWDVFC